MKKNALAIMLKTPEPGSVKTRLVPPLTFKEAAGLYECFIRDIFDRVLRLEGCDIYAANAPEGRKDWRGIPDSPESIEAFQQEGTGLGERIFNVFKYLFSKGYKKVTVIGSDSPDLPIEYIKEAFSLLEDDLRLVLGPAKDGGYYLISMNELTGVLFEDIPWSTDEVLEETLKRARKNSIKFQLLRPWHDIDTVDGIYLLENNASAPLSSHFIKMLKLHK